MTIGSLPANAVSYYESGDVSVVFSIPSGSGNVLYLGTQFPCFTGTKVQILTQLLRQASTSPRPSRRGCTPSSLPRSFRSLMSRLVASRLLATLLINKLVALIVGAMGVLCVSQIASHIVTFLSICPLHAQLMTHTRGRGRRESLNLLNCCADCRRPLLPWICRILVNLLSTSHV